MMLYFFSNFFGFWPFCVSFNYIMFFPFFNGYVLMNVRLQYFQIKKRDKCISIVAHRDTNFLIGFLDIGVLLLFFRSKNSQIPRCLELDFVKLEYQNMVLCYIFSK